MVAGMRLDKAEAERRLAKIERGRSPYLEKRRSQIEDLELRLHQASAWCALHADQNAVGSCLRPWTISPSFMSTNRWRVVEDVAQRRGNELTDIGQPSAEGPAGRLLVYFPDAELSDGAAEAASEQFFDVYNAPPWGTWVGYFEDSGNDASYSSYLLAWVPETLVGTAQAGIDVNPEECIKWLAETALALRPIMDHVKFRRPANPALQPPGSAGG